MGMVRALYLDDVDIAMIHNWWGTPARRLKVTQLFQELQRYRTIAGGIEGTLQSPEARIRTCPMQKSHFGVSDLDLLNGYLWYVHIFSVCLHWSCKMFLLHTNLIAVSFPPSSCPSILFSSNWWTFWWFATRAKDGISGYQESIRNRCWLVVSTPLKIIKVSWDYYCEYMEKQKMIQTTNQDGVHITVTALDGN